MQTRIYQMTGERKCQALALAALLALAAGAHATNYYWDTTTEDDWSNTADWSTNPSGDGGTGTAPSGIADFAFFNGSNHYGNTTVRLNGNSSIGGLTFNNTNVGGTTIRADSGTTRTLTLGTAPGSAITSVAGNNTINVAAGAGPVTIGTAALPVNIVLNGSTNVATQQYWTNYSSNPVNIVGNIVNANSHTTSPNSWDGFFVRQGAFVVDLNGTTGSEYCYTNGASTLLNNGPGTITGIVESGANTLATASSLTIKNNIPFNGTNYSFIINTPGLQSGIGQLSQYNTLTIDGGSVQFTGAFNVGTASFGNNTLNVINGAVFNASGRLGVGNLATNVVNVTGAGSTISGITRNNNGGLSEGGTWNISNGGTAVLAVNTLAVTSSFNSTISGTDPTTGQPSVISFTSQNPVLTAASANAITCNSGGFFDVNVTTPSGNANQIKLNTGGGLAYRNQTGDAFTQPSWATGALVQWSGSNRLYLSGANDTGSTAYTFTTALGTKNYLGLVCAGTNTIARQVSFDNANGATLLFSAPVSATVSDSFTGGMVTNTGTVPITVMGGTTELTVTGGIQGSGGLTLTSSSNGTLKLMSANTYSGATILNKGTLALGASGSINSSSGISIAGGATFDVSAVTGYALAQTLSAKDTGTATVNGAMDASSRTMDMQDGTNLGILALNNNVVLNTSTLKFDLGISLADVIQALGGVSLTGTQTVNVAALTSATSLATGTHAYTLITAPSGLDYTQFSLANPSLTVGSTTYNLVLSGDSTHTYLDVSAGGSTPTIDHYEVSASASQTAGSAFTVTVTAKDSGGSTVVSDSSTLVTLTGSGGVVFDSDGNGTFGDNTKTLAGGTFTISAKTTTAGSVTLTAADGNTKTGNISGITINAAAASQLVFTTQPSSSTVAGVAFAQQPVVTIKDAFGNGVTSGADSSVIVALTLTTGSGTLGGTYSMSAVAGVADFSGKGLNINLIGADKVLTATATVTAGVKTATTTPAFVITPAAASQLVFTTQPSSSTVAGVAFAQQPVVTIKDALGNGVTSGADSSVSVALTLTAGAGTLGGTYSMNAVAGVADFSGKGLNINLIGADKALTATATVTAGVKTATTTPAFVITPAAASVLVFTTHPAGATAGSAFGTQPVVMTRDTYGNDSTVGLAASETVTIAIKTGTGTLQGTPGYDIGTSAGNGTITGSGLRIDQAGTFTLGATGSGLSEGLSGSFAVKSQFTAFMDTQSGVPTGMEGFNADANSDGVDNGLAWILGGATMSNSISLLPQGILDSGYLKLFNFKALKADKRLGTTLSVQYSSDLGISDSWHAAVVPSAYGVNTVSDVRFTVTDNNDDYDTIIAEIPQSKALGSGKLFGRLDAIGQ